MIKRNNQLEVYSSQVAGAIAAAALEDLRVNYSEHPIFPQIEILSPVDGMVSITLSRTMGERRVFRTFCITVEDANKAAKWFHDGKGIYRPIFSVIQEELAQLEAGK